MNSLLFSLRQKRAIKYFTFDDSTRGWDIGIWQLEENSASEESEKPGEYIKSIHVSNVNVNLPKVYDTIVNTEGLNPWKVNRPNGYYPCVYVGKDWPGGDVTFRVSKDSGKIVDVFVSDNKRYTFDEEKLVVYDIINEVSFASTVQVRIECECHNGQSYFHTTAIIYPADDFLA